MNKEQGILNEEVSDFSPFGCGFLVQNSLFDIFNRYLNLTFVMQCLIK